MFFLFFRNFIDDVQSIIYEFVQLQLTITMTWLPHVFSTHVISNHQKYLLLILYTLVKQKITYESYL